MMLAKSSLRWVVAGAAACLLLASARAQERGDFHGPPVLRVSASADVSIQPDHAVVRLGVLAEAPDAADAQNRVNETMQRVLDAMRGLGFADQALRTEDLSLYPVYGNQRFSERGEPQEPRIVGYRASNVVSVEVVELATIGAVIDAGIGAGANQLQGISFGARNDARSRAEAMRLAVEEARIQADAIADALGMQITGVREVVAGGYDVRPPIPYAGQRLAADVASTPVQPGQVDVTASVTVTYEIGEGTAGGD